MVVGAILTIAIGLGVVWIIQTAKEGKGAGGGAPAGPAPATVIVTPVQRLAAQEHYTVTGDLRAVSRAEVAAREAGAVDQIPVNEGAKVKQGDVLVELDHRRLDAERAEADAQIAASRSLVVQREADRNRMLQDLEMKQPLLEKRAISKRELLDAEQAFAVAEAGLLAAKESLIEATSRMELLNVRYQDLDIVAPFDGRVTVRHVEPGEWLTAGQPVVTLVSTGTIEAWLQVPERYAADTAAHAGSIQVEVTSLGKTVPSIDVQVVADVDTATRVFPVIVTLDADANSLAPGMSVRASIPIGSNEPRLAVPTDAIVQSRLGEAVFKVGAAPAGGGLPPAVRVPVKVLFEADGLAYLDAPELAENDSIVVEGNQRLFPNTPLITSPQAPANRAAGGSDGAAGIQR
ncbi:MAG: efflux RND transporter periplasmic adaptor subunit [Verrucomicrobiales bacterium]